ncbi:gpW family head-tail joining protein [Vreelandella populi]|uniref:gpW family head-tail joining protein n=1 Tax=Vreelandella populi TaxID=2498858 RepID=UPI000F8D911C|nr:gpW family head-tail joining protein [Halomonas populi]RUR51518.1 phage tail protein [Halomonas populi]
MAYTPEQLAEVRQAIVALSTGQRVVSITQNGRTVQFAQANLGDLKALGREMAAVLQAGKRRRSRTRLVVTGKGL